MRLRLGLVRYEEGERLLYSRPSSQYPARDMHCQSENDKEESDVDNNAEFLVCQAAFIGVPVHPSASQQQVSDTLRDMGLSVEDEFRCPKSGYSVDMRVHDMRVNAKSSRGAAAVRQGGQWTSTGLQVASWWDLNEAAAS